MSKTKYRAVRTEVDGIWFASKKEAARYGELTLLLRAGKILDLKLQPRFPCRVNRELICTYVADFAYTDASTDRRIIEDAKGFKTPIYKLKRKLVKALFGFDIVEV